MFLRLKIRPTPPFDILAVASPAGPRASGPELFAGLPRRPAQRSLPLACSLALHAALLSGAVYFSDSMRQPVERLTAKYTVRYLRLNAAAPFRLPVRGEPVTASELQGRKAGARRFELPKLPVPAAASQILLQPEVRAQLLIKHDLRVPELLIWRPQPPLPAPPPRKVFVARSRPEEPLRARNLPAPPVLAPPNSEANLAHLAFAGRFIKPDPLLPVPVGSTTPIRIAGGESGPVPEIVPPHTGESGYLNIVSLPNVPVPPAGVFELPSGNLAPASGAASGDAGAIAAEPGGGSSGAAGAAGNGLGAGDASGSPGHGRGMGGTGTGTALQGAGAAASRPVTRIIRPADGRFTVLIESSGSEAFAETEGVLSGSLVYTVYVRAGARKDWILQYCLPKAFEQRLPPKGKAPALEAPYPFVILRPDLTVGPDIDYLIVRGIVDVAGKFDQLTYIVPPEEPAERDLLVHFLKQWQLRPAKLDGQPVAVEILLIIPREGD